MESLAQKDQPHIKPEKKTSKLFSSPVGHP